MEQPELVKGTKLKNLESNEMFRSVIFNYPPTPPSLLLFSYFLTMICFMGIIELTEKSEKLRNGSLILRNGSYTLSYLL